MTVWIVVACLFLFLVGRALNDAMDSTRSRGLAITGTVLDGLAMICMGVGVFGLLMALALGVFADQGPRLTGNSLRDVLIWSGGLIAAAVLMLGAGSAVRGMALRRPPLDGAGAGGH